MSIAIAANLEFRSELTSSHFGGNFLFHRDTLGEPGSYEKLADQLGVEEVRFPGGAVTEQYFDISDPNRTSALDNNGAEVRLVPLEDWLNMASELNYTTNLVLPTRNSLSDDTDANGDRFAAVDTDELYNFVHDVVSGQYGNGKISSFEIGNEYWGSGQMSAVEYGRVSSRMTEVIDQALNDCQAAGYDTENIDIVVQVGTNYDYSRLDSSYTDLGSPAEIVEALSNEYGIDFSEGYIFKGGDINWTKVNNALLMNEFNDEQISRVDGVATHVYTRGDDKPDMRDFSLKLIEDTWEERNSDIETYVTEWNLKSTSSMNEMQDYGLKQAHELLEIMEEFPEHGVDSAYAWPLLQNTRNAFSSGFEHSDLNVSGEMFRLMAESLPGMRSIDLVGSEVEETELSTPDVDVHAFGSRDQLVLFLNSKSMDITSSDFDLSSMIAGGESISVTYLGVEDPANPGSRYAEAVVEEATEEEIREDILVDGNLHADLDAFEVMRVVITQPAWTENMEQYWQAVDAAESQSGGIEGVVDGRVFLDALTDNDDDDDDIPSTPVPDEEPEEDQDEEWADEGDGGGGGIAGLILALLPILAFAL